MRMRNCLTDESGRKLAVEPFLRRYLPFVGITLGRAGTQKLNISPCCWQYLKHTHFRRKQGKVSIIEKMNLTATNALSASITSCSCSYNTGVFVDLICIANLIKNL